MWVFFPCDGEGGEICARFKIIPVENIHKRTVYSLIRVYKNIDDLKEKSSSVHLLRKLHTEDRQLKELFSV